MLKKIRALLFFLPSYLLMMLFTLGAFGWVMYQNMYADMMDNLVSSRQYALESVAATMDDLCVSFADTAEKIAQNHNLTPYALRSAGADKKAALDSLSIYNNNSGSIQELFLYTDGLDTLISSKGEYRIKWLFNHMLQYEGAWDQDALIGQMKSCSRLTVSPAGCRLIRTYSGERFIALMSPLRRNGFRYATLLALVSEDYFMDHLNEVKGPIWIFDRNNHLAYSNAAAWDKEDGQWAGILSALRDGQSPDEKGITYLHHASDYLGWDFVMAIEHEDFASALWSMKKQIFLILGALLAGGLLLGSIFSYYYYRPIHRLSNALSPASEKRQVGLFQQEMQQLYQSAVNAVQVNYELRRQVDLGSAAVRQQLLADLINGHPQPEKLAQADIHLPGPCYAVLMLRLAEGAPTSGRDEVTALLGMSDDWPAYGLKLFYGSSLAVILNIREDEQPEHFAIRLAELVENECGYDLSIGVGEKYTRLEDINRSAMEATTALETRYLCEEERIICYSSLKEPRAKGDYWQESPNSLLLAQAMHFGNVQVFHQALNDLRKELTALKGQKEFMSLAYAKADLVAHLSREIKDAGWMEGKNYCANLASAQHLDDFFAILEQMYQAFSQRLEGARDDKSQVLVQQIRDYINEHFMLPELSLSDVASHFSISESWLSRTFKAKMGVTFLKYVTDLRMETACQMLQKSNSTIKEIMLSVGYLDLASFTRRFTGIYSVTPGQYRSMHQK